MASISKERADLQANSKELALLPSYLLLSLQSPIWVKPKQKPKDGGERCFGESQTQYRQVE